MSYYNLPDDEQMLLEAAEAGVFESVADKTKEIKNATDAAKFTLNKTMNINIRLSQRDLMKLKAKAASEGLPYQTLAASLLHKATK